MSNSNYRTDFLFPRTSFLLGLGSIMNIAGSYFEFNYSDSDEEADIKAIESDWGVIGQDLKKTVKDNPVSNSELAVSN